MGTEGTGRGDAQALAATLAGAAKDAARALAGASTAAKNAALEAMARRLEDSAVRARLKAANARDLEAGRAAGLGAALMDRLELTDKRLDGMADGVRQVVALKDPVGAIDGLERRPNGIQIGRMRVPLGVICIIYESRPNVTVDAGVLCLKSGNAPILKGGKEAFHSNGALVALMREALEEVGLPKDAIQAVATSDRDVVNALIRRDGEVDLVIPRGGEGLIRHVTAHATVPVIQHYKGVCHVYVDRTADLEMASDIAFNAKVQRPGVCNAMETLLVHADVAKALLPRLLQRYAEAGVTLRGCERTVALGGGAGVAVEAATDEDWPEEYLSLTLAIRVVAGTEVAMAHIARYGSGHTEAIVTTDYSSGMRFVRDVMASCVLVNASTRFNDGYELGLGAEIGISTSRLHAYGPMGLEELTTRKFVGFGDGQVRE